MPIISHIVPSKNNLDYVMVHFAPVRTGTKVVMQDSAPVLKANVDAVQLVAGDDFEIV